MKCGWFHDQQQPSVLIITHSIFSPHLILYITLPTCDASSCRSAGIVRSPQVGLGPQLPYPQINGFVLFWVGGVIVTCIRIDWSLTPGFHIVWWWWEVITTWRRPGSLFKTRTRAVAKETYRELKLKYINCGNMYKSKKVFLQSN